MTADVQVQFVMTPIPYLAGSVGSSVHYTVGRMIVLVRGVVDAASVEKAKRSASASLRDALRAGEQSLNSRGRARFSLSHDVSSGRISISQTVADIGTVGFDGVLREILDGAASAYEDAISDAYTRLIADIDIASAVSMPGGSGVIGRSIVGAFVRGALRGFLRAAIRF